MQTVDVGHTGRLTGVVHTDGGIFTCSTDNSVRVVDPVLEPSVIANLTCHAAPVARVSVLLHAFLSVMPYQSMQKSVEPYCTQNSQNSIEFWPF